MPAEQNHREKCSFTWKVGVLTWESCDGFCREKPKDRIREGSITQQAPSSCPRWCAVAKRSRHVAVPHRRHSLGTAQGASQPQPGPGETQPQLGTKQTQKASTQTHFREKYVWGWGSFGFSLAGLSHPTTKPHLAQWWNPESPIISKSGFVFWLNSDTVTHTGTVLILGSDALLLSISQWQETKANDIFPSFKRLWRSNLLQITGSEKQ